MIDVKDTNALDIFCSACFHIPYYQRKYAWDKENCEELFNDILPVAKGNRESHFLSNITLAPLTEENYYVVDGQQRLTTMSLLL